MIKFMFTKKLSQFLINEISLSNSKIQTNFKAGYNMSIACSFFTKKKTQSTTQVEDEKINKHKNTNKSQPEQKQQYKETLNQKQKQKAQQYHNEKNKNWQMKQKQDKLQRVLFKTNYLKKIKQEQKGSKLQKQKQGYKTFMKQQTKSKPKWQQNSKQLLKKQNQHFFGLYNKNYEENIQNFTFHHQSNYAFIFNGHLSLKTNINRCQNIKAFSKVFNDYKIYFNSMMYGVAIKKVVEYFQTGIKHQISIEQRNRAIQILSPFMQAFVSLDPLGNQKYQFQNEQIKWFLYAIRRLKVVLPYYYPKYQQKLQRLINSLRKRAIEVIKQYQLVELITIQTDLIRISPELESEQIYNEILKKRQSYIFNFYSFSNFLYCFQYLQEFSKNNSKSLLDKRYKCFQFVVEEGIKKDGLLKFQHMISLNSFYLVTKNIIAFKTGVSIILKLKIEIKLFQLIEKALNHKSQKQQVQKKQKALIQIFSKDIHYFRKLFLIYSLIPKNSKGEPQSLKSEFMQQWEKIQQKTISVLTKSDKNYAIQFLLSYSDKLLTQNLITNSQKIDLKKQISQFW